MAIQIELLLIHGEEERRADLLHLWQSVETIAQSTTDLEIAKIAQEIVESTVGTGEYKPGWKQGDDEIEHWPDTALPIKWTTIECSQCGNQVYWDKVMRRHRCCECGYGF